MQLARGCGSQSRITSVEIRVVMVSSTSRNGWTGLSISETLKGSYHMLRPEKFLRLYQDYHTLIKEEAIAEAQRLNQIGIRRNKVVVVNLGEYGYCLLLFSKANHLIRLGLLLSNQVL